MSDKPMTDREVIDYASEVLQEPPVTVPCIIIARLQSIADELIELRKIEAAIKDVFAINRIALDWSDARGSFRRLIFHEAMVHADQMIGMVAKDAQAELLRLREATRRRDAGKEWPEVGTRIFCVVADGSENAGRVEVLRNGTQWVRGFCWPTVVLREEIKWWIPLPGGDE